MPELPEVETTRRILEPHVVGRRVLGLEHDDPKKYRHTDLAVGREVLSTRRRGKYLIFPLRGGLELIIHLGMSGSLRLQPGGHTRVRLELEGTTVFFNDPRRFGRLLVVPAGEYSAMPTLARMGPEPFSRSFTARLLHEHLQQSCSALKTVLLSQRPVAGLGNIYADEALWLAKLAPYRPACKVDAAAARRLHRAIRRVLRRALSLGGSTLSDGVYTRPSGEPGYFQIEHKVYGRAKQPCLRCGRQVATMVVGGRTSHYCPVCQR